MLPSNAGRRQGEAGILCLTMLMLDPPRGPTQAKGAFISLSQTRSRHSHLGLELSRKQLPPPPPRLQLTEARDDGARIPSRTTNHHLWNYYLLSHIERSQRCEYYLGPIPHHVPRRIFLPRVCPSLGARLTPLPFIASPFTLLSVTPTRQAPVSPGQPEGRILPTSLSLHLPPLPLVTHANIAWAHAANLLGLPTCSPNLGPQGRRVVSATATRITHAACHPRRAPSLSAALAGRRILFWLQRSRAFATTRCLLATSLAADHRTGAEPVQAEDNARPSPHHWHQCRRGPSRLPHVTLLPTQRPR